MVAVHRKKSLAVAAEDHLDVPGRAEDDLVRVRVSVRVKVRVTEKAPEGNLIVISPAFGTSKIPVRVKVRVRVRVTAS